MGYGFFGFCGSDKDVPSYVYLFLYLMWCVVCAQAVYYALLASLQEGGLANVATQWCTVAVTFGVVILVWIFSPSMRKKAVVGLSELSGST